MKVLLGILLEISCGLAFLAWGWLVILITSFILAAK